MIAASVVRALLAPRMRAFRRDLADPRLAQERLLRDIVHRVSRTPRGREYGIHTVDDFPKLPIVTYDELEPWIDRLVDEPVLFCALTSGSTAPAKRIPTTAALKDSFSRMFALWMHDILAHGPRLETGRFYYSGSELLMTRPSSGLRPPSPRQAGRRISRALAPRSGERVREAGVRGRVTDLEYVGGALNALLRRYIVRLDEQPEVVSIWNPSFVLTKVTKPIESVKLVSCWAAADARRGAEALREIFPRALIQPKGLLATEAPVTIPLFEANGFVPLVSDVFIELFDGVSVRRLHEAEIGSEYELILSQRAGLVRYRIGDRVRATHHFLGTPCLDFIGRADDVCDLAGEKLSEGFARAVVASVTGGRFGVIVPDRLRPGYVVIVDRHSGKQPDDLLMDSPRYREARINGQLAPARIVVDSEIERRLLDRKPNALIRDRELASALVETHAPALQ